MDREATNALKNYASVFSRWQNYNIWYDLVDRRCFSGAQFREGPAGKDHNFCSDKDQFLTGKWGKPLLTRYTQNNPTFQNQKIVYDPECIYSTTPRVEKYKGKSILLLSGGPSTASTQWENVETDYIWSCNKFYLNPRIKASKVDLITLAPNVPLIGNKELEEYVLENDTDISFEIERGDDIKSLIDMDRFVEKHKDRCSFFHTRYRSQPGVSLRLLCYAIFLGIKDIYFVGIDGFAAEGPKHSFELNKNNPNWYITYGPRFQDRQFVVFWDCVLSLKDTYDFNLYNLGEGSSHNVSTDASNNEFPLSEEVKALI